MKFICSNLCQEIQAVAEERILTSDEINGVRIHTDSPKVTQEKIKIMNQFKDYLWKAGERSSIEEMSHKKLSCALASFWLQYTKVS